MSAQIDFDKVSEEELAAMRGDNLETEDATEAEQAPEAEPAPEAELETEVTQEAEQEAEPETPEVEEEPEAAEPEAAPTFMIPKSRYDAVMARLKEAEAKSQPQEQAPAQQEQQAPTVSRMTEIDSEIAEAVKEADGDKVSALMAESRNLQAQAFQQQLQQTSTQTSAQAIEQVKYDTLVEQIETFIPEVDPDGDVYDDGLVVEVQELTSAFQAKGHSSSDALLRALNYVKPGWNNPNAEIQSEADSATETPAKAETKEKPESKKTNVARNLADAKTTPPKMDEGTNSDTAGRAEKLDVMKLSDAEFEKLTEKELAALRGDDA